MALHAQLNHVVIYAGKPSSCTWDVPLHLLQDHGPPSDNHEPVLHQLAVLILEASSWFQPVHFTAAAVAMGACQLYDPALWNNLVAAAEHKVGAFTFQQLAQVLQTLATVG